MDVPKCAGGNQFKNCSSWDKPFQARIHYCPGTEPNDCTYAGTGTCEHVADAETADGICPSVPWQSVVKVATAALRAITLRRRARRIVLSGQEGRFRRPAVALLAGRTRASPRYATFTTDC